jgi:transposase-like protein
MEAEIRRLRDEARRLAQGKHPSQIRYPERFRHAALALARIRLGQEGSVARLARDLGVSEPTLTKWLRPPTRPWSGRRADAGANAAESRRCRARC